MSSPGNLPLENIPSVLPHPTQTEKKNGQWIRLPYLLTVSMDSLALLINVPVPGIPLSPALQAAKKNLFPLSWQLQECRYCVCKSRRAVMAFGSSFYDNTQCYSVSY